MDDKIKFLENILKLYEDKMKSPNFYERLIINLAECIDTLTHLFTFRYWSWNLTLKAMGWQLERHMKVKENEDI